MLFGYLGLGGEKKAVESTRNVLMNEKMALRASTADHKAYVVNMQLRLSDKVKGIRPTKVRKGTFNLFERNNSHESDY